MMFFTTFIALAAAIALLVFRHKSKSHQDRLIASLILYFLIGAACLIVASEPLLLHWPPALQLGAFVFLAVYLLYRVFTASFWGEIVFQALLVLLLFVGGYLYSATQIPYGDRPFAALSQNQPRPLAEKDVQKAWILGLPLSAANAPGNATEANPAATPAPPAKSGATRDVRWDELWPLMQKDSRIREVLQNLREKQERDLSEVRAQLNATSVSSTNMRRHALERGNVEDLLKENAISQARYKTLLETWSLLDTDETAFRERQAEERLHALLGLLEDGKVDESHKVEFIDFMVGHYGNDIRLVKPLIDIYDGLDEEYPRQKRLNRQFLDLYLAKREAVLRGFQRIGQPALQPLLDYRKKILPVISYSQARLDAFLEAAFGVRVRTLYGVAPAKSVADFLNRDKYPPLQKLSGASFEQEYVRHGLRKLSAENQPPAAGEPLMGLSAEIYRDIVEVLGQRYSERTDALLIDPDPAVRANAAWRLAELKNPYTLPLVFELMRDQSPEVRRLAAIAVGNFAIRDTQGSSDPKFTEIVRMLQNYRSNSDAFGRAWAVTALANVGDKQKALYIIDLVLNDGTASNSIVGDAAPSWRDEEEKAAVQGLVDTLKQTPEELSVKTQALGALLAIESPEALDVLLHYLDHVYAVHHARPSLWRYIVPHLTLPQEAENVEDVVMYLAQTQGPHTHKRQLKALNLFLRNAYENYRSGEFFQALNFLRAFDAAEYQDYIAHTGEQIRIMRGVEYLRATLPFWLAFWPISLLALLFIGYVALPALNLEPPAAGQP
ncbi:HEAT repeat domain-containing protein, partial [Methylogaea oryzae]